MKIKTAPNALKRQYLELFWDKFLVRDKQIKQTVPTNLILRLQQESKVLIRKGWLTNSVRYQDFKGSLHDGIRSPLPTRLGRDNNIGYLTS